MPGTKLSPGVRWLLVVVTGAAAGALFGLIAVGIGFAVTALLRAVGWVP